MDTRLKSASVDNFSKQNTVHKELREWLAKDVSAYEEN